MRIAAVVALFITVLVLALAAQPTAPVAGQTMPPPATPMPTPLTPYPTMPPGECSAGYCMPLPTPRPTLDPDDPIWPSQPDPGTGIWYYVFLPKIGRK